MRKTPILSLLLGAACSGEANHLGNPLALPLSGIATGLGNARYNQTRGQVEVFVKTNHPALIADLRAGGGESLSAVYDIAAVPALRRAPHTLQLQSDLQIYEGNLDALVVAIMVVSGG